MNIPSREEIKLIAEYISDWLDKNEDEASGYFYNSRKEDFIEYISQVIRDYYSTL